MGIFKFLTVTGAAEFDGRVGLGKNRCCDFSTCGVRHRVLDRQEVLHVGCLRMCKLDRARKDGGSGNDRYEPTGDGCLHAVVLIDVIESDSS